MGFNDWFIFESVPMAAEARFDEVDALAKDELAEKIQSRLRTQVDPGLDIKAAGRAQRIRVRSEKGQIIIDENDQLAVLTGGMSGRKQEEQKQKRSTLLSLFEPSDGVPIPVVGPDGRREFAFRVVKEEQLFKTASDARDQMAEEIVTETLQGGIVDAYERAIKTVNDRYPEGS